jgi:hypothetical protein
MSCDAFDIGMVCGNQTPFLENRQSPQRTLISTFLKATSHFMTYKKAFKETHEKFILYGADRVMMGRTTILI